MKKIFTALCCLLIFIATTFAQTKDCYPNSSVSFDVIERERIPSITSVEAIGTQCRVDADKKLAEYRNEDEKNFNFLKNKYFAALSGWVQTGDCEHGGPPPCCTAPAASVPWAVVGAEKAKAALMAEWHKVQNQRQYEVEKLMHDCLAGLKSAGINKFNDLYAQADDCLKGIQDIKVVADYNKGLIVGYVNQLNDIHAQMQVMAGKTTPDPTAVTLLSNNMEKLQIEICAKLSQLNNPVKNDPHTGTAMGVRAEVEKPKVESQAITNNSSPQAQLKAAYQQQANNYLNAANNATSGIDKATNLNSAMLNATMSGNKAQAAQIQQVEYQQNSQNVAELAGMVSSLLFNSQAKAERRQERLDKLLAKIQENKDKEADKEAQDYEFELKLEDSILKVAGFIEKDINKLTKETDYNKIIQLMCTANVRFMQIAYLRDRDRRDIEVPPIRHNINTNCFENQSYDLYNLPKDYELDLATSGGIKTADLYNSTKSYPDNEELNRAYGGTDPHDDIEKNYYRALSNMLENPNPKKFKMISQCRKDYTSALQYLKIVEDTPVELKTWKDSIYYFGADGQAGYKTSALELQGEIYYDSARIANNSVYLKMAFERMKKSTDYFISNLEPFVYKPFSIYDEKLFRSQYYDLRNVVSRSVHANPIDNRKCTRLFITTFTNLLIVTDKIFQSSDFNDIQKSAYLNQCLDVFKRYCFP